MGDVKLWLWRKVFRSNSFAGLEGGIKVNDEVFELCWDFDARKEEVFGGVDSS